MGPSDMMLRKQEDGKGYYQRCGAEAGIPELSQIFAMIGEDEVRHADALRALQKEARVDLPASETLEGALPILRRLETHKSALANFSGDLTAYGAAMAYEAANARVCGELAREASHSWERDLFLKIAADDEIHFTLLEQMRDLLEPIAAAGWRPDVN